MSPARARAPQGAAQHIFTGFLLAAYTALAATYVALVNKYVPEPYMDEPFHVPQTQQYCRGNWTSWDPKITTFPGLYLLGTAYARLLHLFASDARVSLAALCTTVILRSLNAVLGVLCVLVFAAAYRQLHPELPLRSCFSAALTLALLPVHFFFTGLYYTDTGSTMLVVAAHVLALQHHHLLSAAVAAAATGFRQTNAVWAAFTAAVAVLEHVHLDSNHRHLTLGAQLSELVKHVYQQRAALLRRLWPLGLVPAAFAAFVVKNGGVVLGDRVAHTPVQHCMQPLYFTLYAAGAAAPIFLTPSGLAGHCRNCATAFRRRPFAAVLLVAAALLATCTMISRYTLVHPYLLADNRHYTFYIWKNFLGRSPWGRLLLAPAYLACSAAVIARLREKQTDTWVLAWMACTAITLTPAWLIEFRYFTVPFVLLFLHITPPSSTQLIATAGMWAAVNVVTVFVFLMRPFAWPGGSIARFMW